MGSRRLDSVLCMDPHVTFHPHICGEKSNNRIPATRFRSVRGSACDGSGSPTAKRAILNVVDDDHIGDDVDDHDDVVTVGLGMDLWVG